MGLYIYVKRLDPPPAEPLEYRTEPEIANFDKPCWRAEAWAIFQVQRHGFDGGWLAPPDWAGVRDRALALFLETYEQNLLCSCHCRQTNTDSLVELIRVCQTALQSGEPEKYFVGFSF